MHAGVRWIRGAIGMGLTWAVAWGLAGLLIGASSLVLTFLPWEAFFAFFDAPLPALAVPGFVGGVLFSVVLGVSARERSAHELSLPRFAVWGALGGLLLGLLPAALVAIGLAHLDGARMGLWAFTMIITPPLTLLGALSGAGSLAIARSGEARIPLGAINETPARLP